MEYLLHILVMTCLYAILATSFNLLIGFAGLFALSHAAFYGLGAYVTAILTTQLGLPFPIPMLVGMVFVAGVGMLIALPAIRVAGEYLVVVSLALQIIVIEVIRNWKSLTGGTDGISGVPNLELFGLSLNSPGLFLPVAFVVAVICVWASFRIATSPFGRALKAMRENESAAQAIGKNIVMMKVVVFGASAGLAAVAGSLFARYFNYVGVDSFLIEESIYILAMVILGGAGNLWGSVLGAVILVFLPEALKFVELPTDIADMSRLVIYGLMMILILMFRPQGLLGEHATGPSTLRATSNLPTDAPTAAELVGDAQGVGMEGKGLVKKFGGVTAVNGFDITLEPGRITGLIGPNGAGKTTAFNLLTGFLPPTAGQITLGGKEIKAQKPHELVRAGVARSFQDLRLFTKMSVIDNVIAALPDQSGDSFGAIFFKPGTVAAEEAENVKQAMMILAFVGLAEKASETAENLSYAEEKLLVVARLLATGAGVLLFDEPLSGLDRTTLDEILPVMRKLAESGKTVCIIEHNLDVITELCDIVYYLDEGHAMAVGKPAELMADPELAKRYFA